MYYEEAAVD